MQLCFQYLAYLALRVVVCVVQALPLTLCASGADVLGWLFHSVLRFRREIIADNLRHAYPELSDQQREGLALAMWRHLFLFAAEMAHTSRKVHATNWKRIVKVDGGPALVRLLLDERPIVLVSAHFGNFEVSSYVLAIFGYRMHAVARPLENPFVDHWVASFRSSTGMRILSKHDDYQQIVDVLDRRGIVAFLADQYAGDRGCWVPFFGARPRPTRLSPYSRSPMTRRSLSADAGESAGPWNMKCAWRRWPIRVPRAGSGRSARADRLVHSSVRAGRAPRAEQYWWLHRRWKDHRAAKKQHRQAA